jgi:hypothetical protein
MTQNPLKQPHTNHQTHDTRFNKLLVSFDSEIRLERDIEIMRISESGH